MNQNLQSQVRTAPTINSNSVILRSILAKTVRIEKILKNNIIVQVKAQKIENQDKRKLADIAKEEEKKKKKPKLNLGQKIKDKTPKTGILDSIANFVVFTFFGWLFTQTEKYLPKLLGLVHLLKGAADGIGWVTRFLLDAFSGFISAGYKVYDTIKGVTDGIKKFPVKEKFDGVGKALYDTFDELTGFFDDIVNITKDIKAPEVTTPSTAKTHNPSPPKIPTKGAANGAFIGPTRGGIPTNLPPTRELKTKNTPRKPQKQALPEGRIGKDIGGEQKVREFYRSPKVGVGGIIGIFRPKGAPIRKTPVDTISDISKTLKGRNSLFGDLASVGSEVAVGKRPDKNVYRNAAKDVVYLAQFIAQNQEDKLRSSVIGMAYGGTVPNRMRGATSTTNLVDLVEGVIKYSVERRVNAALNSLRGPMTFVGRAGQRDEMGGIPGRDDISFGPDGTPYFDAGYGSPETGGFPGLGNYSNFERGIGPSAVYGKPEERALLDAIAFAEGTTKSYGVISGGDVNKDLEQGRLTVQQVIALGNSYGRPGSRHKWSGATGRYQFMPRTLQGLINNGVLKPNQRFTPELQDKAALHLAKQRGVNYEQLKREGLSQSVTDKLAPEWASFPYSPYGGRSYYGQSFVNLESLRNQYFGSMQRQREDQQTGRREDDISDERLKERIPYINQLASSSGQGSRECFSAASAMIASAYLGRNISLSYYNSIRRGYGDTTLISSQTQALAQLGIRSRVEDNGSLEEVSKMVKAGKPVVIGLNHNNASGHYIVVTGVTKNGDFIVNDPNGVLNQTRNTGWARINSPRSDDTTGKGVVYRKDFLRSIFEDRGRGTGRIMRIEGELPKDQIAAEQEKAKEDNRRVDSRTPSNTRNPPKPNQPAPQNIKGLSLNGALSRVRGMQIGDAPLIFQGAGRVEVKKNQYGTVIKAYYDSNNNVIDSGIFYENLKRIEKENPERIRLTVNPSQPAQTGPPRRGSATKPPSPGSRPGARPQSGGLIGDITNTFNRAFGGQPPRANRPAAARPTGGANRHQGNNPTSTPQRGGGARRGSPPPQSPAQRAWTGVSRRASQFGSNIMRGVEGLRRRIFGRKRGGLIGNSNILSNYASYEGYGGVSLIAIQPMIIQQPVPMQQQVPVPIPFPVASGVNNNNFNRA